MDTIVIVVVVAITLITTYILLLRRSGGSDFWGIAGRNPDAAYEFFKIESCWHVVTDPANFRKTLLPEGSWAGPFRLVVPSLGNAVVHIYGRDYEYLESEQRFIAIYDKHMSSETGVSTDIDFIYILKVFISSVGTEDTDALVDQIRGLGLSERTYQDYGPTSGLPDFDTGFHFTLRSTSNPKHLIEVLDKGGQILQAGIQVFGNDHDDLKRRLTEVLTEAYGQGVSISIPMTETSNYTGNINIAYLSDCKIPGAQSLTVRVGNKRFWNT